MNVEAPRAKAIFLDAVERCEPQQWPQHLDEACAGDPPLRCRVEVLLRAHARSAGLLDELGHDVGPTVDEPASTELIGSSIGPYKLLEVIGEGGMGVVYMAERTHPVRRKVALKVIKPGMDTRQVIARFEAERQALAMMDHPNIARVFNADATESGRPYFVMELVRGIPITDYCDRERLSIPERLGLFVLVCRAVQHAHQKGVIHRDLKPSNVLVTVIDGAAVPKVIDFGVSKATGTALTDRTLFTGFAQLIGTPHYMSPEQADLSGVDVDTRSDVYALGVLLYELLTGTTPIDRDSVSRAAYDEIRRIIREQDPPTPSKRLSTLGATLPTVSTNRHADLRRLSQTVRGELDWIVMKALEKDRRRRYETPNDFAADVMRHLTDQTVEACPPSAWYRFAKLARRNRRVWVAGLLVALALTAGTGVSTWQAVGATRARRLAEARSAQARRAVDDMYTQVAEKWLRDQPGVTTLQREFLEKALAFYETFAAEAGPDPQARFEALRALHRVVGIQHKLGRLAEAEAACRRVVALGTDLISQYPDRPEVRLELAYARIRLAALRRERGLPSGGQDGLRVALKNQDVRIRTPSRETGPSETERQLDGAVADLSVLSKTAITDTESCRKLGEAHIELSDQLGRSERFPEAEVAAQGALKILSSVVRDHPSEIECRFSLARAHSTRASCSLTLSRWGEAETSYRQAEGLMAELLETQPSNPRFRHNRAEALINLGVIRLRTNRAADAEESSQAAVNLLTGLAAEFPDRPSIRDALAIALSNLAAALNRLSRDAEAEAAYRRSVAVREELVERYPDVPEYASDLSSCLLSLATALDNQGKPEEARRVLERAIQRARAVRNAHPDWPNARNSLANALHWFVPVAIELGDRTAATQVAEEDYRDTLDRFGNDALAGGVSILGEQVLEDAIEETGMDGRGIETRSAQQREAFREACVLHFKVLIEEAAKRGGDQPETLYSLADLLSTAPQRFRDPGRALALAEKAVTLKPEDGMCRQSLGMARYRAGDSKGCVELLTDNKVTGHFLAMACWQLGEKERALEVRERSDEWLTGYERRCEERRKKGESWVYPWPSMLRRVQAEASALIKLEAPESEGERARTSGPDTASSPR